MNAPTLPPPVNRNSSDAYGGPLRHFFHPRAIAVIGAGPRQGSVGRAVLENLCEFDGRVFPVNPKHASVLGMPAFGRVADLPVPVDLAVIATPAQTVPGIVRECGSAGVSAAIVLSAGFRECGPGGLALENAVLREAREGGVRVLGPNCLGLMLPHRGLNATFALTMARPGSVAFVSQSGALCTAVLDWSLRENVGFSAIVSVGSLVDVGWGDVIAALGHDAHTRSIVLYMESIGDARSFLSAAREASFTTPIVVVKAGRTEAAARAASSHTGALAGGDDVVDAAFRRVGVLRVESIEDLFDMAEVLGKQSRPKGNRLGILTNAGGPAALAVDRLVVGGGAVAPLGTETLAQLNQLLPAHWSHGDPVDLLGDADEQRYARAFDLVAHDSSTDGLLVVLTPQAMTDALGTAQQIRALAPPELGKPVLASWMGGTAVEAGETVLNEAGIPTFKYPDRAAMAFNYLWRYSTQLEALYETPLPFEAEPNAEGAPAAREIIAAAKQRGRLLLSQYEAKRVLAAYGIPVVESFPAFSETEAVALAGTIGFPVAMKVHSETLAHKRQAGGVRLNLRDANDVRTAWHAIQRAVSEKVGAHHFLGVTVEQMIVTEGVELIVGSSVDPQFGPVILFGAGGRWVEVLRDRALGLPPLTSTLARRLMEQTRIHAALKDAREPAVDFAALEQMLVRFSHLVAGERRIKEIDINPLLAAREQIVALDARIVLHDPAITDANLPTLAIRPYPRHYAARHVLSDRARVLVRSIRADDEPLMARFHAALSSRSVYFRYFRGFPLEQRINHATLARHCCIDYDREIALVALHENPLDGEPAILGVARLRKYQEDAGAEFAVAVADAWQRRGLGTLLLRRLIEIARDERVPLIVGKILAENEGMLRLCERLGFEVRRAPGDAECEATLTP